MSGQEEKSKQEVLTALKLFVNRVGPSIHAEMIGSVLNHRRDALSEADFKQVSESLNAVAHIVTEAIVEEEMEDVG